MAVFHLLTLKKVIKETSQAVSLCFVVPDGLKKDYVFTSGQYVSLETTIKGEKIRRAYSISSIPEDLNKNRLQVTVKAIKGGIFSNYATQKLQSGDTLKVSTPEGNFSSRAAQNHQNILCVAAGSGITPIFSIIKNGLLHTKNTFTLIYGNKKQQDTIFKSQLDSLARTYSDRFKVFYVLSQEKKKAALTGRIDENILDNIQKQSDKKFNHFFLCGPEGLIHCCKNYLTEKGIAEDKISTELFFVSPKNAPENFEKVDSESKTTQATIFLDDAQEVIEIDKRQTILAAVLEKGLDPPYSCQGGVCSSCMAKVTEGKAVMSKNTILTDEEVDEGFILTCMAHPVTEKISINFDEV